MYHLSSTVSKRDLCSLLFRIEGLLTGSLKVTVEKNDVRYIFKRKIQNMSLAQDIGIFNGQDYFFIQGVILYQYLLRGL